MNAVTYSCGVTSKAGLKTALAAGTMRRPLNIVSSSASRSSIGMSTPDAAAKSMVEMGAVARAKTNLARLQKLCPSGCVQLAALSAAISRGPAVAAATPPSTPKRN